MKRNAFTLFEVLLSLAVLTVLAGSLMGFFWNLLDRSSRIAGIAERQQGAAALIERLESDLLCGLAASGAAAGIKGDAEALTLLTRGVWMPERSVAGGISGDLQGCEFRYESGSGVLRARRWSGAQPTGDAETVCENVELLRFRYFDGKEWSESFDSSGRGGLPVAIEVAVWFGRPADRGAQDPMTWDPEESDAAELPERDPDRVRLVIVPDGPVDSWKEPR